MLCGQKKEHFERREVAPFLIAISPPPNPDAGDPPNEARERDMSIAPQLGQLERVNLRDVWPDEARNFTPWLAAESNISLLGDVLDMELEVQGQEMNVGPFKADILCKDTSQDEHFVLIENQLERTNHTHMGQLITYAAGLDAVTIVWIAERFTDEHRAAMDWLNKITDEDFRFFGLEIELWKIGASLIAPKFNVISSPNEWTKSTDPKPPPGEVSDLKQTYKKYWTKLWELLHEQYPHIRGTRARPQHWCTYSIGRSGFSTATSANTQKGWVRVELVIKTAVFFELLAEQKEAIEAEIGEPLDWQKLPNKKMCRIALYRNNTDPIDEEDWEFQHAWLAEYLDRFDKVFRPRIKALNADDWVEDDDREDEED